MLVVSAVHIVGGWIWHTAYRARWHWKLKREGALMAAAAVVAFGAVDSARSMMDVRRAPDSFVALATKPVTASATPVVTEARVVEIQPSVLPVAAPGVEPVQTVASSQSPSLDNVAPEDQLPPEIDDPIAAKIVERLGDPAATASIADQHAVKPKPVRAIKPVVKPAPKAADRSDESSDQTAQPKKVKPVKSAKAPATKPATASVKSMDKSLIGKALPPKRIPAKKNEKADPAE